MKEKHQNIIDSLFGFHVPAKCWSFLNLSNQYIITNFGEVISIKRKPKILKKAKSPQGYFYVSIMHQSKPYKTLIHRIVAEHFVDGKTGETRTVNHKDWIKENNNCSNLEWATYSQNNMHAMDLGLSKRFSENHYLSKLRNCDIPVIKEMRASGVSITNTAKTFGVSRAAISSITSGRTWRRV